METANHSIRFIFQEKHGEFNLVLKTIGRGGDRGGKKKRRNWSLKSYEQHYQLATTYIKTKQNETKQTKNKQTNKPPRLQYLPTISYLKLTMHNIN